MPAFWWAAGGILGKPNMSEGGVKTDPSPEKCGRKNGRKLMIKNNFDMGQAGWGTTLARCTTGDQE